jgi:hypothetical protein
MNKYALNAMPLYGLIQLAESIANNEFDGRMAIFKSGKYYRVGFGIFRNDFINVEPEDSLKTALIAAILEKRVW